MMRYMMYNNILLWQIIYYFNMWYYVWNIALQIENMQNQSHFGYFVSAILNTKMAVMMY